MSSRYLPVDVLEQIFFYAVSDTLRPPVEQYSNVLYTRKPHQIKHSTIRAIHDFLLNLSLCNSYFRDICSSDLFTRNIFETIYPTICISVSNDATSKSTAWSHASRKFVLDLAGHNWRFIWRAYLTLMKKSYAHAETPLSLQQDNMTLWFKPPAKSETVSPVTGGQDCKATTIARDSCFMKFVGQTKIMIFSSSNSWVIFDSRPKLALFQPSSVREYIRAKNLNKKKSLSVDSGASVYPHSPDTNHWEPPRRSFVFEDLVSISSLMNTLHFVEDPENPKALQYEKCRVCQQTYPLCGKVTNEQICGSCLYVMDLDVYGWCMQPVGP